MGQDEFERIQPAELDVAPQAQPVSRPANAPLNATTPLLALAALVCIALAVIFLLPRFVSPVSEPQSQGTPAAQESASAPSGTPASSPQSSPWQQAQQERERQTAKSALEELLQLQFELQERGAEQWAAEDFAKAVEQAKSGDEAYRGSKFNEAREYYANATAQLKTIRDGVPERLADYLARGSAALDAGDAETARQLFGAALQIEPQSEVAAKGLRRAGSLEQVMPLLQQARAAQSGGDSAKAEELYASALKIDPDLETAKRELESLRQQAREARYAEALSRAYAALAAGDAATARTRFQDALKINPGGSEARDGLQQASFQLTQSSLGALMRQAEAAAAAEKWQDALEKYRAALKIDPSLNAASQGSRDAEARLAMEAALETIVRQPGTLASSKNRDNARRVIEQAAAIGGKPPRLASQLEAARAVLQKWDTPQSLAIRSDGRTAVTVFRVGNLGSFELKQLELKPGRYVAIGQRNGYRDVRVEFDVAPLNSPPTVVVQCSEQI